MSQIATAYIVATNLLDKLGQLAATDNCSSFRAALHSDAAAVTPHYEYSGYVVAIVVAFLEETGAIIPINSSHAGVRSIMNSDPGLLLCAGGDDIASTLQNFRALHLNRDQLQEYFEEFTGDNRADAEIAMQAALDFLISGLQQAQSANAWLLVFVG